MPPNKTNRIAGGKFSQIRSLECFDHVIERIRSGATIASIADYIQQDRGECADSNRDTLMKALGEFRRSLPPGELIVRDTPDVLVKARERFSDGLRELERLDEAYEMQRSRVNMGMEMEKKLRVLNGRIGPEVSIMIGIVKTMHDIKMDLGMNGGRDLGTVTIDGGTMSAVQAKYGDDIVEALSDAESRGRVLATIQQLAGVLKEKNKS